jgi:pimeloyl-ACP methyl ester carboxylesterase
MDRVLALIHEAVTEAGLDAPVVVGHSMSGGYGSMYAARFPTRGVVNVDALPDIVPFVRLLQNAEKQIRGSGFADVWAMMEQGFRLDLLPPSAQAVVARTSSPRQDLVVSYWDELLSHTPDELAARVSGGIEAVAETGVPYLLVLGAEPPPEVAEWLHGMVPKLEIEVWADTGHFPHLAYPDRFAARLAATAGWRREPDGRRMTPSESGWFSATGRSRTQAIRTKTTPARVGTSARLP